MRQMKLIGMAGTYLEDGFPPPAIQINSVNNISRTITIPSNLSNLYLAFDLSQCKDMNGNPKQPDMRFHIDGGSGTGWTFPSITNVNNEWAHYISKKFTDVNNDSQITVQIIDVAPFTCAKLDNIEIYTTDPIALPPDQALDDECPLASCSDKTTQVGGPISTLSGNYNYQDTDFYIPTRGQPLLFERTYNSLAVLADTKGLGYGWTHNYDLALSLFNQDGKNQAVLKAAYLFARTMTETKVSVWTEIVKLLARDGEKKDLFGSSVALRDPTPARPIWPDPRHY